MATKKASQAPRAVEPDRLLTATGLARVLGLKREFVVEWLRRQAEHLPEAQLLGMSRYRKWRYGDVCELLGVNAATCTPATPAEKEAADAQKVERLDQAAKAHKRGVEQGLFRRELKF